MGAAAPAASAGWEKGFVPGAGGFGAFSWFWVVAGGERWCLWPWQHTQGVFGVFVSLPRSPLAGGGEPGAAAGMSAWKGRKRVKEEAKGREGKSEVEASVESQQNSRKKETGLKSQIKIAARQTQVCSTWE